MPAGGRRSKLPPAGQIFVTNHQRSTVSDLSQFSQYRIESRLGESAFTETFHAIDIVRHRPVALKLLKPGLLPDQTAIRVFLAEAQLASELIHPRIAWVWETGQAEDRIFLTERYWEGESLAARLNHTGPISWEQALQILQQIRQALDFSQERGWVHGCISPSNILIGGDSGAALSNYGLLRGIRSAVKTPQITLREAEYLPPEILPDGIPDLIADAYALACTLVKMVTGKNLFAAESLPEIQSLKQTVFERPVLPFEITPPGVDQVIRRALSPNPAERFRSPGEFVDAMQHTFEQGMNDTEARARYAEQLRLWREREEKSRLDAEEAARLAALERARREIQERARLEAEEAISEMEAVQSQEQALTPSKSNGAPNLRRKPSKRATRRQPWRILVGITLILALVGLWLFTQGPLGRQVQPSPTIPPAATTSLPVILPPTATDTLAPSPTPTLTITVRPSATSTRRPTQTPSPTLSPVPTDTQAPPTPSPTTERLENDERINQRPAPD